MFVYYNPNTKRKVAGDCVIRAICAATGMSWDEAYWSVCIQGFIEGDMPSSNSVWRRYLLENGFSEHALPNTCPACYTVMDFCEDNPNGVFILFLNNHVVCVKNGDFFDTWNSGDETPMFYFKKEW